MSALTQTVFPCSLTGLHFLSQLGEPLEQLGRKHGKWTFSKGPKSRASALLSLFLPASLTESQ